MGEQITGTIEDVPIALAYQRWRSARAALQVETHGVPWPIVQALADAINIDPARTADLIRMQELARLPERTPEQDDEVDRLYQASGLRRPPRGLARIFGLRSVAALLDRLLPSDGELPDVWGSLASLIEHEQKELDSERTKRPWFARRQSDAAATIMQTWLKGDARREALAQSLAGEIERVDVDPESVRSLLKRLGIDPLPHDAATLFQAGMLVSSHRTAVPLEALTELMQADDDLANRTGMTPGIASQRAGYRAMRRLTNPSSRPRRVVSGGLPTLGRRR